MGSDMSMTLQFIGIYGVIVTWMVYVFILDAVVMITNLETAIRHKNDELRVFFLESLSLPNLEFLITNLETAIRHKNDELRVFFLESLSLPNLEAQCAHQAQGTNIRDPKAINQALWSGAQVETVKKFDVGSNKKEAAAATAVNARKLDEAGEPTALEKVSVEVRHAIQKARIEKKMSQAELAKQINERPPVVQEYENGKSVPNQAVLAKMERVLGVKLRGKIYHK
ncbi:multiprotein-bridging factor 1c-like [Cornus florida]|uniref:multiprotein-bridging factor 1c-like n=1 Tax=Cornus florida TaxID=4283 RepID=UPI0028973547|nr:multiprotein-bridging factor 1c-like [Cornus florida]